MRPEDKYKGAACFALPLEVWELLFDQLQPMHRFVDKELVEQGCSNHFMILNERGSKKACFYVEAA